MKTFHELVLLYVLLSNILTLNLKLKAKLKTSIVNDLFINGDFHINSIPSDEISDFQKSVFGWNTDDEIEVGIGKYYNSNWEEGKIIVELDGKNNDSLTQIINVSEERLCKLSFRYAATYPRKKTCEMRVKFNGLNIFQKDLSDDYLIHEEKLDVLLVAGNNLFSFEAFIPQKSDGYGMNLADVKLLCEEAVIQEEC